MTCKACFGDRVVEVERSDGRVEFKACGVCVPDAVLDCRCETCFGAIMTGEPLFKDFASDEPMCQRCFFKLVDAADALHDEMASGFSRSQGF